MNQNEFAKQISNWYPEKTEEQLQRWDENGREITKSILLVLHAVNRLSIVMKRTKYGKSPIESRVAGLDLVLHAMLNTPSNEFVDHKWRQFHAIIHYTTGMVEESAEILEQVFASICERKPYNKDKLLNECGDLHHYMTRFTEMMGFGMDQIRETNYNKCRKRFGDNYTDQKAIERKDENE